MIAVEDEVYIWEGLLHSVSNLLSDVDSGRSQVRERWDDPTPAFDQLEHLLSEAYGEIEGRLQEVDPEYSERKALGPKARAQAKKVLSYGVNFQGVRGLPYDETDSFLRYVEEHGLASMSYDATRQALQEYRAYRNKLSA